MIDWIAAQIAKHGVLRKKIVEGVIKQDHPIEVFAEVPKDKWDEGAEQLVADHYASESSLSSEEIPASKVDVETGTTDADSIRSGQRDLGVES